MENYLGLLEGPTRDSLGSSLYNFGYTNANQPPAQAATTASQLESGGSGFNWNAALSDITRVYLTREAIKSGTPEAPTTYRTNEYGEVYAADPAYRGPQTLGGVGNSIAGIPVVWLIIGAVVVFVVTAKD